ncbi:MAG TPA: glycine--tRNA ligase subunit alpha [Candidatus Acidoferrales bacterium]|nr:glycine--tRNA ligase subunit alpha [Candidatus Acidoferrales bacterium]
MSAASANAKNVKRHLKSAAAHPLRSRQGLTFQDLVLKLEQYWTRHDCILQQPYDVEVGAGTMHPETFLRVLGPEPYRVVYAQPSRRPADGRYGENPNRLFKHTQLQVILKPSPADVQDLYLESLGAVGINLREHDIRLEEDNWESPTLGAWGIGWQVLLDGLEITQFTYFQQCGGVDLDPISVELTYGLDRIAAYLQGVDNVFDVRWSDSVTYREVRLAEERQFSAYSFDHADAASTRKHFEISEAEAARLLAAYGKLKGAEKERFPVLQAYDFCLKCSHLFNLLDARGAISVTERAAMIGRVRKLATQVARAWLDQRSANAIAAAEEPSPGLGVRA